MYVLVEVIEREIFIDELETYEEAYECMKSSLEVVLGESLEEASKNGTEFEIDEDSAWVNVNNPGNCDWKIFKLNK